MRVHRVFQSRFKEDALTGNGAKRFGGRWNPKGVAAIYTSEHLSIAVLEIVVHTDPSVLRVPHWSLALDIPDRLVSTLDASALPPNWQAPEAADLLQEIGEVHLDAEETLGFAVASALLPYERNVVLNPNHVQFDRVRVVRSEALPIDPRLPGRG